MISLIPQNCTPYLAVFPDSVGARLSLADLCELQTQYPQRAMGQVVELLTNHVNRCPHCSTVERVCCGKTYCKRRLKAAAKTAKTAKQGRKGQGKGRMKARSGSRWASTHSSASSLDGGAGAGGAAGGARAAAGAAVESD